MTKAGLYLHVPFCSAICPYCDFSVLTGGAERRRGYLEAVLDEIRLWGALIEREGLAPSQGPLTTIDTMYLGGGTPSALAPEALEEILAAARRQLPVEADARVTLEANPEDVTPEACAAWRALGVGTLSLGVQSFDAAALAFLGRRHTRAEAQASVETALAAGFETVSVDLIYGYPGHEPAAWRKDLQTAVDLGPQHVSCYQLTVHRKTPFGVLRARGDLTELPGRNQAELFRLSHRFLTEAGYEGYEVSNFARATRHRSRHNRKYWEHAPYLGLGPSAHSFASGRRWWNLAKLAEYEGELAAGRLPIAGEERLDTEDLALESLMLGLRTAAGIDLDLFRERYEVDLEESNASLLAELAGQHLLRRDGRTLRPTLAGLAVADGLARSFRLVAA